LEETGKRQNFFSFLHKKAVRQTAYRLKNYLSFAKKNSATVPGPACEPITGPMFVISTDVLG
jgi:hypothetical protein